MTSTNQNNQRHLQPIKDVVKKRNTKCKRTKNLIKKCLELSVLCELDINISIYDQYRHKIQEICTKPEFTLKDIHQMITDDMSSENRNERRLKIRSINGNDMSTIQTSYNIPLYNRNLLHGEIVEPLKLKHQKIGQVHDDEQGLYKRSHQIQEKIEQLANQPQLNRAISSQTPNFGIGLHSQSQFQKSPSIMTSDNNFQDNYYIEDVDEDNDDDEDEPCDQKDEVKSGHFFSQHSKMRMPPPVMSHVQQIQDCRQLSPLNQELQMGQGGPYNFTHATERIVTQVIGKNVVSDKPNTEKNSFSFPSQKSLNRSSIQKENSKELTQEDHSRSPSQAKDMALSPQKPVHQQKEEKKE